MQNQIKPFNLVFQKFKKINKLKLNNNNNVFSVQLYYLFFIRILLKNSNFENLLEIHSN